MISTPATAPPQAPSPSPSDMPPVPRPVRTTARRDLVALVILGALTFVLAQRFALFKHLVVWVVGSMGRAATR